MSRAAVIDYEAIALECDAICNVAKTEILKIDKLIETINERASNLLTNTIISYEKDLLREKKTLLAEIDLLLKEAEVLKGKGQASSYDDSADYKEREAVLKLARNLENKANDLSTNKLLVIEHLINEELFNISANVKNKLMQEHLGIVEINADKLAKINAIEDVSLREMALIAAKNKDNKSASFARLLEIAQNELDDLTNEVKQTNKRKMLQSIAREMRQANVSADIIKQTINDDENIDVIRKKATREIINEEVRKKSLEIILKTIRERGFIVDSRKHIKINRETNEVTLVGRKVTGERAEFKIYIDGRFVYHFDGYEGQACQEDLQPFLEDLENIYGFKMEETSVIWSNPDKLTTKKYQAINTRKGKK